MPSDDGMHVDPRTTDIVGVLGEESKRKHMTGFIIPLGEYITLLRGDYLPHGLSQPTVLREVLDVRIPRRQLTDPSVESERRVDATVRVQRESVDIRPPHLAQFAVLDHAEVEVVAVAVGEAD